MLTTQAFVFFLVLLLVAVMLEPLAEKFHFPFPVVLVVTGFLGSEIATRLLGIDTGIRWQSFQSLIFYVILPVLIFRAALEMNITELRRNLLPIFMLSVPLMLVSTAIIATGIYYGIGHESGFPWIAALLAGALLSATDPAAVLAILKRAHAPPRLGLLLEGESLFNDATAIVLFSIIIGMTAAGGEQTGTWGNAIVQFLAVFFGGLAVGAMIGIVAHLLVSFNRKKHIHTLVSIISAYSAYIIADDFLHLSGVMAVLSAGIVIGSLDINRGSETSGNFVYTFWNFTGSLAESLIFLLAGVTVTLSMFTGQWLAVLIGIAVVLFARFAVVFGAFPLINLARRDAVIPFRQQLILGWGGVRGTVTLALALSLPVILDYWYTLQSIAYGVVLFTLFIQTPSMNLLVNRLDLRRE